MWDEYSRKFTQISRFFEENAIVLVGFEGLEGGKFTPRLHHASSIEIPGPNTSTMPERRPKRKVPKPGKPVADS